MTAPIIELRGVSKRFGPTYDTAARAARSLSRRFGVAQKNEVVQAVDNVDLAVERGEVVGLVGEFGCGKSTLGRMVAGIMPPSDGEVLFKGNNIATLPPTQARDAKLKVQMIFQDPYASLNPRLRVEDIVGEAPLVHKLVTRANFDAYLDAQLHRAGLDPTYKRRYPHQFSGGQRQRIGIARALAVQPEFLVCDEAVAALDVSIQAQILNLFMDLRTELDLTYLFISHDLGVVEHLSDRVLIMYLGRIVESAPAAEVFARPNHPYTQALLAEVPRIESANASSRRSRARSQPHWRHRPAATSISLSPRHAALRGGSTAAARNRCRPQQRLPPERSAPTMRVLVWQWGRRGGAPRFAVELAAGFRMLPDTDALLSLSSGAEILRGRDAPHCDLPVETYQGLSGYLWRLLQAPWIVQELARRIATLRPQIAIAAHPGPFDLVMLAALRRNRVRLVVVVHDADAHPGDGMPMRLWLQRKLIRRADAVVALTEHVAARLREQAAVDSGQLIILSHPPFTFDDMPPPARMAGRCDCCSLADFSPTRGSTCSPRRYRNSAQRMSGNSELWAMDPRRPS